MATEFLCLICSDTFTDIKVLAEHMVAHQFAPLGCDRCGNQTRPVVVDSQGEALCNGCRPGQGWEQQLVC